MSYFNYFVILFFSVLPYKIDIPEKSRRDTCLCGTLACSDYKQRRSRRLTDYYYLGGLILNKIKCRQQAHAIAPIFCLNLPLFLNFLICYPYLGLWQCISTWQLQNRRMKIPHLLNSTPVAPRRER